MATEREDEVDYESDPEETKQSLAMRRRRAASDDEESEKEEEAPEVVGGGGGGGGGGQESRMGRIRSEDSDSEGGAADYDDEEGELEEEEEELDVEEEEEEGHYEDAQEAVDEEEVNGRRVGEVERNDGVDMGHEEEKEAVARDARGEGQVAVDESLGEWGEDQAEDQVEKKENEPFAVPTAGAFYMHDDRFRDNAGGRNRRTFGGRKLWESKDERKWGHDKFEEMTIQDRRFDERRRTPRGNYRGRGRNRGVDRGYVRGNRARAFDNNSPAGTGNNSGNQSQVPRGVRGRGPRRYESSLKKSSHAPSNYNKQYKKSREEASQDNSGQVFTSTLNTEADPAPAKKHIASSLNYASPPFYPSSSSSKDIASTQKKDVQVGNLNRNNRASVVDDNFSGPPSSALSRGKNIANSVGIDKLSIDDSVITSAAKPLATLHVAPTGSSVNTSQSFQTKAQGRAMAPPVGRMPYQNNPSQGQSNRLSPQVHVHAGQRSAAPNRVQTSSQVPGQRPGSGSQASSPPKTAASVNSYETAEMESASEPSKSAGALVAKGKGSVQGGGRGSFVYSGAHVMGAGGNMGVGHGDQNFPGTPAFLPVMQFGGQHPGVPAVGMAFPGYVAQPQLGLGGNSEMTWLPVLAGAAGALGATYCSPYLAVDGAYHAPSGQTTSMGTTSKEGQPNKPNSEWKPSQKPELVSEEHGQRQNKPRRYSEMNFGQ